MTELKFKDIMTIECLLRPFDVKTKTLRLWSEDVLEGLVAVDKKRIENLKNSLYQAKHSRIEPELDHESGPNLGQVLEAMEKDQSDLLNKALTDPKAPFHPNLLPKSSHLHPKQFGETVSHSGYLTFASKRQ